MVIQKKGTFYPAVKDDGIYTPPVRTPLEYVMARRPDPALFAVLIRHGADLDLAYCNAIGRKLLTEAPKGYKDLAYDPLGEKPETREFPVTKDHLESGVALPMNGFPYFWDCAVCCGNDAIIGQCLEYARKTGKEMSITPEDIRRASGLQSSGTGYLTLLKQPRVMDGFTREDFRKTAWNLARLLPYGPQHDEGLRLLLAHPKCPKQDMFKVILHAWKAHRTLELPKGYLSKPETLQICLNNIRCFGRLEALADPASVPLIRELRKELLDDPLQKAVQHHQKEQEAIAKITAALNPSIADKAVRRVGAEGGIYI